MEKKFLKYILRIFWFLWYLLCFFNIHLQFNNLFSSFFCSVNMARCLSILFIFISLTLYILFFHFISFCPGFGCLEQLVELRQAGWMLSSLGRKERSQPRPGVSEGSQERHMCAERSGEERGEGSTWQHGPHVLGKAGRVQGGSEGSKERPCLGLVQVLATNQFLYEQDTWLHSLMRTTNCFCTY